MVRYGFIFEIKIMFSSIDVMDSLFELERSMLLFFEMLQECNEINIPQSEFFSKQENDDTSRNGHINRAIKAYSDIWYTGNEDGRTTRTYQGVIAGQKETIEMAIRVNDNKNKFHETVKYYTKELSPEDENKLKEIISKAIFGRKRLSGLRLQRINLNSCYRKIPYSLEAINKISYSLIKNGKSIKRLKVSEVRKMLKELGGEPPYPDRIKIQLGILNQFNDNMYLARIQDNSPIIKANISLIERDPLGNLKYISKKPPLPLIIKSHQLPKLKFYSTETRKEAKQRKIRDDRKIEESPLIKSLRVHKYL